jgi:hypothetical protein
MFGAVASANHGLDIAAKKANENASLPTLENETAANAGSNANRPKAEANENDNESNGDGDTHGDCVSKAAKNADDRLTNAGAELDKDPWRRGAFISTLARTDHDLTTSNCDAAISAALSSAMAATGPGKSDESHGNESSEAKSKGQETAENARGDHGPAGS